MNAPRSELVLSIDIGGTKVALGLVDPSGSVHRRARFPTPRGNPADCLTEILDRARSFTAGEAATCGVALPAVVSGGRVEWSAETVPDWGGVRLAAAVQEALRIPCAVEFDGYAATLGEHWMGRAAGYADAVVLIVGTGIGAGIIHDGELFRGRSAIAGGVGWMRWPGVDGLGPKLERIASGPAILASARAAALEGVTYADAAAVFRAWRSGDEVASAAVERAVLALGAAVGVIVALLGPQIVILSGGVGSRRDLLEPVRHVALTATQPVAAASVEIDRSRLGGLSSFYGAAYLAHQLRERTYDRNT